MTAFQYISINGNVITDLKNATVSIWDTSFHRGDGVFEVMRLLPKTAEPTEMIRRMDKHMTRLQTSANAVGCPLPPLETVQTWLVHAAEAALTSPDNAAGTTRGAPGCLRLIATKGNEAKSINASVIISWAPLPVWPESFTLYPILAPWHCAGAPGWETPIKWTSYGPNVVSTQKAKTAGFSDALLVSGSRLSGTTWDTKEETMEKILQECHVLDGPNFAISWIRDNVLFLPDVGELGLLPSITQEMVCEWAKEKLGLQVQMGVYALKDLLQAEEVYVSSTTRGIIPVTQIGSHQFPPSVPRIRALQKILAEANGTG